VSDDTDETAADLGRIEAQLDELEGALVRLDDGSYGVCASCGGAIADERLQSEPTARWCGACKPGAGERTQQAEDV
jgi:DnaK suppressor protein